MGVRVPQDQIHGYAPANLRIVKLPSRFNPMWRDGTGAL